ncbi:MAG TPA: hypothetical protein VN044_05855 [Verrucomicrobiae bacterium]|nr:hypothetical protein [Verrucomicrobiae bacterium]
MKTLKTTFLLTALTLLLLALGQAFGGERGMTLALAMAVFMNGTAYSSPTRSLSDRAARNRSAVTRLRVSMR